jgi:hypothetical protein
MTSKQYIKYHKEFCDKMIEITKKKNADYSGSGDAFSNFTAVEKIGITTAERGFLTRMMDKICRINTFVERGFFDVKDESVEDTLLDLANYSALLAGYIKNKKCSEN